MFETILGSIVEPIQGSTVTEKYNSVHVFIFQGKKSCIVLK